MDLFKHGVQFHHVPYIMAAAQVYNSRIQSQDLNAHQIVNKEISEILPYLDLFVFPKSERYNISTFQKSERRDNYI